MIEGVDDGRLIAQLTKVHHATIDGASGARMLASILDVDRDFRPTGQPAPWTPDRVPTDAELLERTFVEYLRRPEKTIRLTVRAMRELVGRHAQRRPAGPRRPHRPAAPGAARRVPARTTARQRRQRGQPAGAAADGGAADAVQRIDRTRTAASPTPRCALDDAKEIRRAVGCTFNDVVMALCSGTLRRYLQKHDCLPDEPLIAMVPVSVRSGDESDAYQNRVSAVLADLATNEADPARRLARVQTSMDRAKTNFRAIPAETLQDFTQFAPPAIAARAMRMYSRLKIADRAAPPFNLVISNVPGPAHPLYSAGARLKHFYPVSALIDGQGLNMTVQSYDGNLDFGFIADRELVPDVWLLTELLHESMAELLTLR